MGESGCMSTIVSCKEHDHSKHDIYDICETNEGSEVSMKALATRLPSSFLVIDRVTNVLSSVQTGSCWLSSRTPAQRSMSRLYPQHSH
ncbi:uncharacterized protein LACBIDRAFT_317148 [Laccaria bicolor S238N-H82]|uniref:Predicted protein n=1 Tax=Laccaria bicolor (strain S238N-H82 / ATCC MYA-4686) TaxID=486041 RepID=B0D4I3_LACBS|nr:uncharacterized protein LACBIDRAFT_317148 [Laccaria bicolor S238N-H82]EDR10568.1 predicted protein [Laccaria bicolor S238N-H82]|eukprot:XP_001879018.1 predicted protein [Laccaria bicolor S238N-H82]